jgi:hypothetical protein
MDQFEQGNAARGHAGEVEAVLLQPQDRPMTPRRFPPPWTVIENADSFWVQDARLSC